MNKEVKPASGRIATNTGVLFLSQVTSRFVGVFYLAALARYVGPEGIGELATATALCGLLVFIVGPGLDVLLMRDIAADHRKVASYVANGLFIRFMLGIVFVLLVWLAPGVVHYSSSTAAIVRAYSLVYLFDVLGEILAGAFRAFERMEYDAASQIMRDLINVSLSLVAIYLHQSLLTITFNLCLGPGLQVTTFVCSSTCSLRTPASKTEPHNQQESFDYQPAFWHPAHIVLNALPESVSWFCQLINR